MPSAICALPIETLTHVIGYLRDYSDVSALSRCGSRFVHAVATPLLYARVKGYRGVLCWACDEERVGTVKYLLASGADPNAAWHADTRRSTTVASILRMQEEASPVLHGENPDAERRAIFQDYHDAECARSLEAHELDSVEDQDTDSESDSSDEDSHFGYDVEEYHDIFDDNYIDPVLDDHGECSWSPLHIAARWGNCEIAALLLDHGAKIDAMAKGFCDCVAAHDSTRKGPLDYGQRLPRWTPLHTAICHGNDQMAELLLSRGASLDIGGVLDGQPRRITALHSASASGATCIARLLIQRHSADVEAKDHLGQTPISYAYFTGMWECIDLLLESGATLNARIGKWPLLKHACKEQRFAEAIRMIDLGIDVQASYTEASVVVKKQNARGRLRVEPISAMPDTRVDDKVLWTMAILQAASNHLPEVIKCLAEVGADRCVLHEKGKKHFSALHVALTSNMRSSAGEMLETVSTILNLLAKQLTRADVLDAVLTVCGCENEHNDKDAVVHALLQHRGDMDLASKTAQKLWTTSIKMGNIGLCISLLSEGLKPPTKKDIPQLMAKAFESDSVAALEYLLTLKGAKDVMISGRHLFDALKRDAPSCALFLIDHGAPVEYRAPNGLTSLCQACVIKNDEPARRMLAMGADPNQYGKAAVDIPLLFASDRDDSSLVRDLVNHGAHIDGDGLSKHYSPLQHAIQVESPLSVRAMVKSSQFQNITIARRIELIRVAVTSQETWDDGETFNSLISGCSDEINRTIINIGGTGFTPLHFVLMTLTDNGIATLLDNDANMHFKAHPVEGGFPPGQPSNGGEQLPDKPTTPLEWAIAFIPDLGAIEELLEFQPLRPEDAFDQRTKQRIREQVTHECLVDYIRAACERAKPELVEILIDHKLDFKLCDAVTGDTAIHMICDGLKEYADDQNDVGAWPPHDLAVRVATCLCMLTKTAGVAPTVKNRARVSGLEAVRRVMTYEDEDAFWKEVAECWDLILDLDQRTIVFKENWEQATQERWPDP